MYKLGIDDGDTTSDGRFTLVELECLGACGTAPVALVNEALYEELTVEKLQNIIDALPEDPHDYKDPTINFAEANGH
jgi:NADH:ubiquinone oxidoreductase subunit E